MIERERPLIDHEAVREIGGAMARRIGELASQEADRDAAINFLNDCANQVPYEDLFEEDKRLASALGGVGCQIKAIDEELSTELQRLDGLVATFAAKQPRQLAAARKLVSGKKEAAKSEAEQKKAPLEEPFNLLSGELEQLSITIESVAVAWPVAPYSDEVLAAAEEERLSEEDEDWEEDEFQPREKGAAVKEQPVQEEIVYGPYAELAESIPVLSERLESHLSKHLHIYGKIETAKDALEKAQSTPAQERTEEQGNLIKAIYILRKRWLMEPDDLGFLKVYEAKDVIELAIRLNRFKSKNRPDFNDLEGQILDKAAAPIPLRSGRYLPDDLQGSISRMTEDAPGRSGMTWHSLVKHANRACDTMRYRFLVAGGIKNEHLKDYVIEVADKSGTSPDISWIYQFIADDFAFDVLARRIGGSQASAKDRFMKNCETINSWLEEAGKLLDQIPADFRLKRNQQRRRRRYFTRNKDAVYENVTAYTSIMNTIRDIEIRRDGTGDSKVFRHKPVGLDPAGALNHQLRLGHMIDLLKAELATYMAPTEGYTEEITPFE